MLSKAEVAEHNSKESCWVIVDGQAYDLTDFLDHHPGGSRIILRYAGQVMSPRKKCSGADMVIQDATAVYEPVHPPGTIERYLTPGEQQS